MSDTPEPVSPAQRPPSWRFCWVKRSELQVCCPYCSTWVAADTSTMTQGKYSSAYANCPRDGRILVSLDESVHGPDVGTP